MRIFITGKVGSGKSTYARSLCSNLSNSGYRLADFDEAVKSCEDLQAYKDAAIGIFGTDDRRQVSRIFFSNSDKRAAFELRTLPLWTEAFERMLVGENLIVDFPLAFEAQKWIPSADMIIGVDAEFEIRQTRACARLGWPPERFAQVDALQLGSRAKMALSDLAITNNDNELEIEAHARRMARDIQAFDHIAARATALIGQTAWRAITRAYAQSHRRYHGARHLQALFNTIDIISPEYSNQQAVGLAILYHDFVYDTAASYSNNEAQSILALSCHARDFFSDRLALPDYGRPLASGALALAAALIDATKGHSIVDPWLLTAPERTAMAQAFLDADLAILGGSTDEDFAEYDDDIRQEFIHVPPSDYHRLRAQALESFLRRPHGTLYLTAPAQAWENIARKRLSELCEKHAALATLHHKDTP